MAYPEPSLADHNAPWNLDEDEGTGEWVCSCIACLRKRRDEARDYEDSYDDDYYNGGRW